MLACVTVQPAQGLDGRVCHDGHVGPLHINSLAVLLSADLPGNILAAACASLGRHAHKAP